MNFDLQEERLRFWDRLVRGEAVDFDEVSRAVTPISHEVPDAERMATVFLLAAVQVANTESRARRGYLRAALWYWFSQCGVKARPPGFNPHPMPGIGLIEVMGLHLTWPDALVVTGFKRIRSRRKRESPADYTALRRLEECLREHMVIEWKRVFGSAVPEILEERR